jgi:hypothetical protein
MLYGIQQELEPFGATMRATSLLLIKCDCLVKPCAYVFGSRAEAPFNSLVYASISHHSVSVSATAWTNFFLTKRKTY